MTTKSWKYQQREALSEETRNLIQKVALQRKPMSMESQLKCAVNVRPITITNLDGTNPQSFSSST